MVFPRLSVPVFSLERVVYGHASESSAAREVTTLQVVPAQPQKVLALKQNCNHRDTFKLVPIQRQVHAKEAPDDSKGEESLGASDRLDEEGFAYGEYP